MNALFCCPLCAQPLTWEEHCCRCAAGHSFDRASEGYAHLLPANRKHSKNPGDDKQMVAARCVFLDKGYYAPLRDALCSLARRLTDGIPHPVLFDSGCGEGYYSAGLARAVPQALVAGIDISKFAVRRAAKRLSGGQFAVASAYRLPVADDCVHLLTNIFSPLSAHEFARVVAPGGFFVYVVPSQRHLWQMKEVLYQEPYENPVKREDYTGFVWQEVVPIRYTITLDRSEDIMALFAMTPYAWKTPREGVERLSRLARLDTEIGFDLHIYQRDR